MLTVELKPIYHRKQECIAIIFKQDNAINTIVKKIHGIKWSITYNCWYMPDTKQSYQVLQESLKNIATINSTAILNKLQNQNSQINTAKADNKLTLLRIYEENAHVLPKLQQHLQLKGYSNSTIKTYLNEVSQLLYTLKNVAADTLSTQRIKDYLQYCHTTLQLSESTLHSRMNALKFYYEQVLHKENFFGKYPDPKSHYNYRHFLIKKRLLLLLMLPTILNIKPC